MTEKEIMDLKAQVDQMDRRLDRLAELSERYHATCLKALQTLIRLTQELKKKHPPK